MNRSTLSARYVRKATYHHLPRNYPNGSTTAPSVAASLHVSTRQLYRSFEGYITPLGVLQFIRLIAALVIFAEDPQGGIEEVALAVGLTNRLALHRLVQSRTGKSPSILRDLLSAARKGREDLSQAGHASEGAASDCVTNSTVRASVCSVARIALARTPTANSIRYEGTTEGDELCSAACNALLCRERSLDRLQAALGI